MPTLQQRAALRLDADKNPEKQAALYELCRRDPKFWFNCFCYTYDPRVKDGILPFNLYPFQEWFLDTLRAKIDAKEDVNIEKSRDMGISWCIVILFQWYWLFSTGFSAQLGSLTEEDVDKNLTDPEDTLFGKLRFNLEFQPPWIIGPKEYTNKHLSMKNHKNGNIITGRAPTSNFGRGARKTVLFYDEIPFWQWQRPAYESGSQTADCRIMNGTPNGKFGVYGEAMTDPSAKRLIWPGRTQAALEKGIYGAAS